MDRDPTRPLRSFKINPDSLIGSDNGMIAQELMEEFLSSSSDDETTDGEGGGNGQSGEEASSGSEMMSLHSDASSDDFKEDQEHLANELDILNESFHAP